MWHSPRRPHTQVMLNLLPSIFVLGLAALAAWLLARDRPSPVNRTAERFAAARMFFVAIVVQALHFTEETLTRFNEQLPALFGMPSISFEGFVVFNLGWLVVWIVSIPVLRSGRPFAFFAAWFLAIAGMANGVIHPLLAMAKGGYFPGLFTSPISGLSSMWLWHKLRKATQPTS